MVNYTQLLEKSFNALKENYVIFTPIIIGLGLLILFAILGVIEVAILFMFGAATFSTPQLLFTSPFVLALTSFFALADVLILIALSAYIKGMYFGMYKEVVETGFTSIDTMYKGGKELWISYFQYNVIAAGLFLVPIAALALLYFLSPYLIVLSIIIFIIYSLILSLGLLFAQPMIAIKKESVWEIIKKSMIYARENKEKVLITWLITVGISLVANIILTGFQQIPFVGAGFAVLTPIVMTFIGIFFQLFVFFSYKEK